MDRYKCEDLLVHSSRLDLSFVKLSELIYIYMYLISFLCSGDL